MGRSVLLLVLISQQDQQQPAVGVRSANKLGTPPRHMGRRNLPAVPSQFSNNRAWGNLCRRVTVQQELLASLQRRRQQQLVNRAWGILCRRITVRQELLDSLQRRRQQQQVILSWGILCRRITVRQELLDSLQRRRQQQLVNRAWGIDRKSVV